MGNLLLTYNVCVCVCVCVCVRTHMCVQSIRIKKHSMLKVGTARTHTNTQCGGEEEKKLAQHSFTLHEPACLALTTEPSPSISLDAGLSLRLSD